MRKATVLVAIAMALALLVTSCGAHEDTEFGRVTADMPGGFELPAPKEVVPAFVVVVPGGDLDDHAARRVRNIDAVKAAALLRVTKVNVESPTGDVPLQLATTQPLRFRPVAPHPTRDADFVWTSLIAGQAVLTYEAAQKLGVEGAEPLAIEGLDEVRVGAFAENGTPTNLADILVADHIIDQLPGDPRDMLVVGTEQATDSNELARALTRVIPKAQLVPLIQVVGGGGLAAGDAPDPVARGSAEQGLGGTMSFTILEDGWIEPEEAWVQANIASATVPIIGEVTCHRVMIPQLAAALAEIERDGLASLIRPEEYAGCYAPRFIDRNPNLPLSNHAFGLAVDLNTGTNQLGTPGDMDPRVVAIFEKWGFEWGGHWERPDPMHFELARLLPQT